MLSSAARIGRRRTEAAVKPPGAVHLPSLIAVGSLALVLVGCLSVSGPASPSSSLASASLATQVVTEAPAAVGTVKATKVPCQPGDARTRCQTPTPVAPTERPTDTPLPTGTPLPTDTPLPTGTPLPAPTGSNGGVDTDLTISTLEINFGKVASGA